MALGSVSSCRSALSPEPVFGSLAPPPGYGWAVPVGTARLALNVALQHYHCAVLLRASWFVECDEVLARAVE
eukprot:10891474-Alexandrium_andersonii.AAC.1